MRRYCLELAAALWLCGAAYSARLLFTTRTAWDSPVVVSAPSASKEFGFQSVVIHNTSTKMIDVLDLSVMLQSTGTPEEEVDAGRIHVSLEAGHSRRFDVYLGQIRALEQKARQAEPEAISAVLSVRAAEFADGSEWHAPMEAGVPIDMPVERRK
jgi:hypothetical protein